MQLKIQILLSPITGGNAVTIKHSGIALGLEDGVSSSITLFVDYRQQGLIKLFSLENILEGKGQTISITGILLNGVVLKDWRKFCRFELRNNRYSANETLHGYCELSFNGTFFLDVDAGRDQFLWFVLYHSDHKLDFVYKNSYLDCNAPYHCMNICADPLSSSHKNRFFNRPYALEYTLGSSYDYGCFGDSFTLGEGLMRGDEWPALLEETPASVVNISLSGVGIDGIFLNLLRAMDCFHIKKAIIVLPTLHRQLLRFAVDEHHFRIPVSLNSESVSVPALDTCIWFSHDWLQEKTSLIRKKIVKDFDGNYSKRVIRRMISFLNKKNIPYYLSSWDKETHDFLSSALHEDCVLPLFPGDRGALDGVHSSAESHRAWLSLVESKISQ
jgi:hypothetical protein